VSWHPKCHQGSHAPHKGVGLVIIIIILGAALIIGVIVGIDGMVRLGIARQESGRLLLNEPSTQAATAAQLRAVSWFRRAVDRARRRETYV
jgi:hypothetical protein